MKYIWQPTFYKKQTNKQKQQKRLQKEMLSNRTNMQFVGTDALNSAMDKQLYFNDSEKVKWNMDFDGFTWKLFCHGDKAGEQDMDTEM